MITISVVICTFNRADLLAGAIASLCQQTLPPEQYEIIVVDNASTDGTCQLVTALTDRYPSHTIVYLYEGQLGLGYARNTGFKQAQGVYVAYMDDDALLPEDWLSKSIQLLQTTPQPMCVGGKILPFYTTPKPDWFKDSYATATWGEEPRLLRRGESFSGSNMIWRRTALEASPGFDVHVGVKGHTLSLGEETILFDQFWQQMEQPVFYYAPDLIVQHWVPPFKMKAAYKLKRQFIAGEIQVYRNGPVHWYNRPGYFRQEAWKLIRLLGPVLRRRKKHTHLKNWLVEDCYLLAYQLGVVVASLGLHIRVKQGNS
ncbi:MAG TPA: glycosyltransferase family A protein [Aggregatilineaceae bacterium]|nr:glycosyltransferase family A protein [Aggregatilineaceae bacterium]